MMMIMSDRMYIPFSSPSITEREIAKVTSLLRSGRIASTEENLLPAKKGLQAFTAGHEVLLTTSCTSAMELGLGVFDLKKEDRVILPSFTFVSTANAILVAGGTPVFVDIEEHTLNLDLDQVEAASSAKNIRGIIPVHYASISCDMDRLLKIAAEHNLFVLEDAAHAVGALYNNRYLGTLGDFGAFSFHDTKNYVAGEGGALVINNKHYRDKAVLMYEKGTNRQQFLRGEVDKYTWVSRGGSYVMSAILAALLEVQLQRFEEIRSARAIVCKKYREGLQRLVDEGHIVFTDIPSYAASNYHKAFFLMKDSSRRDALLAHLKAKGIGAVFHYIPLHLSSYAEKHLGTQAGQFPVAERVAESIVRLPLFPHLPQDHCDEIIEEVIRFFHPDTLSRVKNASKISPSATIDTLDMSLIVPCYNEAPHLHKSLNAILEILDRMQIRYEIILIDDCSKDATAERIREYKSLRPNHNIHAVFHSENRGRGATVTEGVRIARGRVVGFIDIDLEISASYIPSALLPLLEGKADVIIAERFYRFQLSAAKRYLMSKGYRWLVRFLLQTPPIDTESGFKFFRRDTILGVLDAVVDTHWFWDTEVSIRALDAGLRISSVPVLFHRQTNKMSTVRACSDSMRSSVALFRFRKVRKQKNIH